MLNTTTTNVYLFTENSDIDENGFLVWIAPKIFPYITFPLIVMFGIPFNVLSLLTILKSSLWKITLFRYMAIVSLADLFIIIGYMLRGFAYAFVEHINELTYTILTCKIFTYLAQTFGVSSSLCLVAVTVDRYLCIVHPMKAKVWSTLGTCNKVTSIICLSLIITNFFTLIIQDDSKRLSNYRFECTSSYVNLQKFFWYWRAFLAALYSGIPVFILGALNFFIIKNLKKHTDEMLKISRNDYEKTNIKNTRKLTILNICISMSFTILTIPLIVIGSYVRFSSTNFNQNIHLKIAYEISYSLNVLNHIINFLFYCICGETFRKQLQNLFRIKSSDSTFDK